MPGPAARDSRTAAAGTLSALVFVAVALAVAALFVAAAWKVSRAVMIVVPVFWLAVPAVLAGLAFSRFRARLAAGVPLAVLVGYQAFRVPVEWVLHRLYTEGVIPVWLPSFLVQAALFGYLLVLRALASRPLYGASARTAAS